MTAAVRETGAAGGADAGASIDRPAAGRLPRYALWQARDYALGPGVATLLIGGLFAGQARLLTHGVLAGTPSEAALRDIFQTLIGPLAFFVTLLGTNGIVSTDRTRGYFRLLFAKPVSVRRYYLQAFAVRWLGCIAAGLLVVGMLSLAVGRSPPPGIVAFFALHYLALGGIVFLASTLSRFDWLIAAVLWNLPGLVHVLAVTLRWPLARLIDPLLPPTYAIGEIIGALLARDMPPAAATIRLVSYGVVCLGLGLIIVRRRALAQ